MSLKKQWDRLTNWGGDTIFAVVGLEGFAWIGNTYLGYDMDYIWPLIVGPAGTAFLAWRRNQPQPKSSPVLGFGRSQAGQEIIWRTNSRTTKLLASLAPNIFRQDTKTIRYREPKPEGEFYWNVPVPYYIRKSRVMVYESRLLHFCNLVWSRQQSNHPHPLSRNELMRPAGPISQPHYYACAGLLKGFQLVDGRAGGSSGNMRFAPARTVRVLKTTTLLGRETNQLAL